MDCPDPNRGAAAAATAAGLPEDALVEIFSRLPVKSLRRSKCVSKAWRDLIADPLHRKKLPQTLQGFFYGDERRYGYDGTRKMWTAHYPEYGRFINLLGTSEAPIVDPSFPFLKDLPQINNISLVGSCNGLLLLDHEVEACIWGYIVCNPATEQWVSIPAVDWTMGKSICLDELRSLIFDPAASPHFHVVLFRDGDALMQVYSSKTGAWRCSKCDWGFDEDLKILRLSCSACVNGILYFVLYSGKDWIIAVDVEGNTWKILPPPLPVGKENCRPASDYVGQSQGHLHYVYHMDRTVSDDDDDVEQGYDEQEFEADDVEQQSDADGVEEESHADDAPSKLPSNVNAGGSDDTEESIYEMLFIWVLEDYDTQKWVLKHNVSFLELFGRVSFPAGSSFDILAIHPDRNLVFLVQNWNQKLISYDMDSREVRDLCTLPRGYGSITPYVPYFSELPSLENKL